MAVQTVIEHGTKDKRSVAFSLDWPGWSRGAKTSEFALETVESFGTLRSTRWTMRGRWRTRTCPRGRNESLTGTFVPGRCAHAIDH